MAQQKFVSGDGSNDSSMKFEESNDRTAEEIRQALLRQAQALNQRLAAYLQCTKPDRWLQDARRLGREQPELALGGAFLLGAMTAGWSEAEAEEPTSAPEPLTRRKQDEPPPLMEDLREPADPIGVGSPIGDSPFAGGSSGKAAESTPR